MTSQVLGLGLVGHGLGLGLVGHVLDSITGCLLTECDCRGEADLCKQDDGSCYCNTRGVVGDRCTQYVPQKFFVFIHIVAMLAVTVYRCLHGLAPSYLAHSVRRVAELTVVAYVRRRLMTSSSRQPDWLPSAIVPLPLPAVDSGTVYHLTLHAHKLCLSSVTV